MDNTTVPWHQHCKLNGDTVILPKTQPIDIEFLDITYSVSRAGTNKMVLHGLKGNFRSGELTAIMGPSGSGKTTFLHLLSGFLSAGMGGQIYINGTPRNIDMFRKNSCYILQTDQLNPHFTVSEVLHIAANLKLGPGISHKSREITVQSVMNELGLVSCCDTRAASLSGGQQKRLSIALELLDNPPVMFLDEPTTGLDSASSLACIKLLSRLADGGRTVVCTLHQPSAHMFETVDHVYLLSRGRCAFQGDSRRAVSFFEESVGLTCPRYHNPADFMLDVASGEEGNLTEKLEKAANTDHWRQPSQRPGINPQTAPVTYNEAKHLLLRAQKQGVSEWSKFYILLRRSFLVHSRNLTTTHTKIVLHICVGLLLGLLYSGAGQDGSRSVSNVRFYLMSIVYLGYTAMMPAVLTFPTEMHILRKERFNNWYSLRTYYAASTIAGTPLQVIFSALYVCISYFLSGQVMECSRFMMFFFVCLLVSLLAEGLGLLLGACLSQVNGTFVGSSLTALWIMFSGLLILYSHTPRWLQWMHFTSYMHYAFEALTLAEYGYDRETLWCPDQYCHLRNPKKLLDELSINQDNFYVDMIVLVSAIIVLRVCAYWGLRRRLNSLVC